MSKRRNNDLSEDNTSKDNTQPTAKRARNPPGFRVSRPPSAQSASRSTAASSSSGLTNSHITSLVIGSNGRLAGRRTDRSHFISPANIISSTTEPPEDENIIPSEFDRPEDLPEDAFQANSIDVPTEPKPKRKRNNNTRVCDFFIDHYVPD